ncbi:MAG TPA: UDP-glucose/GDP-mannose dehydrogenase family protein [Methanoregulaceae archaeon]|nr:UDP-glucose/GDP-mannose dehydrogenase family protein [Methanoregulaceae archaeon]
MRIAIVGAGHVGAVTGACLAEMGHSVVLVDRDERVRERLVRGEAPFFEPGLGAMIRGNRPRLETTADLATAVGNSRMTFLCVGTPSNRGGEADLSAVRAASAAIGEGLSGTSGPRTVVVKSTVPPGTTAEVVRPAVEAGSGRSAADGLSVVMNPEFLREGSAVRDFFLPDRIVIGADDPAGAEALEALYRPFSCPRVRCTTATAEMVKYASNAFLAVRVSCANEIGILCKSLGIDAHEVLGAVGLDGRIGPRFLGAGLGFGGSCFPKDVRALVALAGSLGCGARLLSAALEVNDRQPAALLDLLEKRVGIAGRRIGVLGLAFKPGIDDVRESRAIPVVQGLLDRGARVVAHDPMAMEQFRQVHPGIEYAASAAEVVSGTDATVIVTEWPEFEGIDYSGRIVVDGRRCRRAEETAAVYEGICW